MKHILATTALATLLGSSVFAQTDPATDPAVDPAAPMLEEGTDRAAEPMTEGASPDVVQDDTVAPDAATPPVIAEEVAPLEGDADTMATDEAAPLDGDADSMAAGSEWAPVDLATFSTDRLIGANIVTAEDETIATIEDVLISDTGEVENIVAQFGGFLGFGANKVLLTIDEIEVMQNPAENLLVRTSLTRESIESRPAYE